MSLAADKVRWSAGGRVIVDDVSLAAEPGTVLGLVGPNGSGKSSLLRLLAGLRTPAAGVVTLDGTPVGQVGRRTFARRVALVEQHATTDADVTVLDVVRLGRTPYRSALSPWTQRDDEAVREALAWTDLADKAGQSWRTLSGGERQRVHLARALAQTPTELILDEPTNHLDIRHQIEIMRLVSRRRTTTIMALHDLNLAALFCHRVAVMQAGRVVAVGTPGDVLTADSIATVFGVRAHVETSPVHGRPAIQYLA